MHIRLRNIVPFFVSYGASLGRHWRASL